MAKKGDTGRSRRPKDDEEDDAPPPRPKKDSGVQRGSKSSSARRSSSKDEDSGDDDDDSGAKKKRRSSRSSGGSGATPGPRMSGGMSQAEHAKKAFLYTTPFLIIVLLAAGIYVAQLPDKPAVNNTIIDYPGMIHDIAQQAVGLQHEYQDAQHSQGSSEYGPKVRDIKTRAQALKQKLADTLDKADPSHTQDLNDEEAGKNLGLLISEISHDPGASQNR